MGNNILKASVTIQGVRPLLFHRFGPDSMPLEKREKTGVAGNDPEEWKRTVLMTADRQLYLDPTYVFGCLRDGARYTKKGKGSIQTVVSATLQVVNNRVLVDRYVPAEDAITTDPEQPVYLDIRGVKNPTTKGRNVRYRVAASPGWKVSFDIVWDKTIVSRGEIENVIVDAGRLVGIGNGRSIGFGRFEKVSFSIEEG